MTLPARDELEALARGLRSEALQVRRAKELAEFSMEPDTLNVALRAQSPEVTTVQAAELVGWELQRYREARSALVALLTMFRATPVADLPAGAGAERAVLADVGAAWSEYRAAVDQSPTPGAEPRVVSEEPSR